MIAGGNADFNTSSVSKDDDVLAVPLGVGFGYRYQRLILDARALFRGRIKSDRQITWSVGIMYDPPTGKFLFRWGGYGNDPGQFGGKASRKS